MLFTYSLEIELRVLFQLFLLVAMSMVLPTNLFAGSWDEVKAVTTQETGLLPAPGPYPAVKTIPAGSSVTIGICFHHGDYCAAAWNGSDGYVDGSSVASEASRRSLKDMYREYEEGLKSNDAARSEQRMTGFATQNAFSAFKRKANAGESASLLIWSDSTGNSRDKPGRWPDRLAGNLAAHYPSHTVSLSNWDPGNARYDKPIILSKGTTDAIIEIHNFAVTGSVPQFGMGPLFETALASVKADGIILNHGINYFPGWDIETYGGSAVTGAYIAAIAQIQEAHPNTPISMIIQNPNRDSDVLRNMPDYVRKVAGTAGLGVIDVSSPFMAAGRSPDLYMDSVHPSNPKGNEIYSAQVWDEFQRAPLLDAAKQRSIDLGVKENLIQNASFQDWSGNILNSWTAVGSVSTERILVKGDDGKEQSQLKLSGPGGNKSYIEQSIPLSALAGHGSGGLSFCLKKRAEEASPGTVGRFAILMYTAKDVQVYNSSTYNKSLGTPSWWCFQDLTVPAAIKDVRVRIYPNSSAGSGTVWLEQVTLAPDTEIGLSQ